jgi:hypothetical protein
MQMARPFCALMELPEEGLPDVRLLVETFISIFFLIFNDYLEQENINTIAMATVPVYLGIISKEKTVLSGEWIECECSRNY